MSSNISEVLIDKYLLDKYLAPYQIDSEGTQLTVSMISVTNTPSHSPHVCSQPRYLQPCCPTTPNIHDDIITTHRPIPCYPPIPPAHTVISSLCSPELFHSSPVSQPSSGPWSTIDRYEQRSPLARDFTQRTNNIYQPNHLLANMNAPDVLATPEQPDNYNDDNSNGLALWIREVRASSCNLPDICWSTIVYDDLLTA